MPFFSCNSRSNPERSGVEPQHLIQLQNTYKQFKRSVCSLFRRSPHHDNTRQMPGVEITALGLQQTVSNAHGEHVSVDIADDTPQASSHGSSNPPSMGAETCNPFSNIAKPAMAPVTSQFQDAHDVNISGNTQFTNIGVNDHSINFYGGTHGLENLKEFVSFAALHDSSEQDPDRRCHPGTRENVLRRLRHWIDNPNATDRIFWLHGPAGAGKSAIAQTIANGYDQGEVAATFFFYRSDPGRNDGNRLFPTIAWQLAFSIPATKDYIVHALDKTPHLPKKRVETQFEHLVANSFLEKNNVSSRMLHPTPVVIIDGVDECSDEQLQQRFLTVIGNAVKDCRVPLRFLISSRAEAIIEETLDQFQDSTPRIDLASLDDAHRDIEKYLVDKFSEIASKQGLDPSWPGQEIIQEFVFKSLGNFIFASTVMKFIGDEDYSAKSQLDIIRKLKPRGTMSPFALLDELYLEILKRQRDQDFLKTFLALLVGRSSIERNNLHKDDALLMNVSEKELHIKLRRMRSLLKFKPFIDVHHRSFLDFLQDPCRSGQYHVSQQAGQRRYLELIVDLVVLHISTAIGQPDCHKTCRSDPKFTSLVVGYKPEIVLSLKDWQEALKPLMDLQDRLLNSFKPKPCRVAQAMCNLQLHLVLLQMNSHHIIAAQVPETNINETVTKCPALTTEAEQKVCEKDLDSCLCALLSHLRTTNSVSTVDAAIIDHMYALLAFDYTEIVARVRSVSDAQKLIDIIDLGGPFNKYGPDTMRKAAHLASEIFARVPLLPRSLFLSKSPHHNSRLLHFPLSHIEGGLRISCALFDLAHVQYMVGIYSKQDYQPTFYYGDLNESSVSVDQWLESSSPNFVSRIQVMLEIARAIRYIHGMDVRLHRSGIRPYYFFLDSNLHAKVIVTGIFGWWVREASTLDYLNPRFLSQLTHESNMSAFADLFHEICFGKWHKKIDPGRLAKDARRLIKRCRTKDSKSLRTMEDVVKEMETWILT